ncbi:MAG: DMT family transporter, partial [Chloroflexota bacterium]
TRLAQGEASSLIIAAYRLTISSIILGVIILIKGPRLLKTFDRKKILLSFLSGLFLALHFASWITSLEYTTVASSVVLVTTTPLWVALLSPFILKEPIRKNIKVGLAISMMGGVLVGLSDICQFQNNTFECISISSIFSGRALLGDGLALFGAFMAAGYMIIGRKLRSTTDTLPYTFIVYGIAAVIIDVVVIIKGENLFDYSSITFAWFIVLAIVPQLLGHSVFNWALRFLPASVVSIALLGEPIGSTLLAYIVLNEIPMNIELGGAILILLGIVIASLKKCQPNAI